ncbi:MAG: single-stranded DNA-binding protein [Candidatus Riflebacteria bacterium]|nr:single-stranded DNA-binding protein [Candidatus Riflebacteria bacterium]
MAANLNKVFLIGNLTRDPELRHTAQGTSVAHFSLAVNRSYKGADGEFKRDTNFFNIVVWGRAGENCAKYLSKGRSALVEGRLQNRSYETQDGQKRTFTEIVADNVQFLSSASDRGDYRDDDSAGFAADFVAAEEDDDTVPF